MTATRRIRSFGLIAILAMLAGAPSAYALTTMEAPVNQNGARYAAPDPDQRLEQQLNGQQGGEDRRGFSIQMQRQDSDRDRGTPFDRQFRQGLPWLPGAPLPSR